MSKPETTRMDFESYQILKNLIESALNKLEKDFRTACNFIPSEQYKRGVPSGIEKAHKIFSNEHARLKKAQTQLHVAASATYKDHPKKEMRQFWGLE